MRSRGAGRLGSRSGEHGGRGVKEDDAGPGKLVWRKVEEVHRGGRWSSGDRARTGKGEEGAAGGKENKRKGRKKGGERKKRKGGEKRKERRWKGISAIRQKQRRVATRTQGVGIEKARVKP